MIMTMVDHSPAQTQEPSLAMRLFIVATLCVTTVMLLAVHSTKHVGWLMIGWLVLMLLMLRRTKFARDIGVVVAMIALLGITPIDTSITINHMLIMGATLAAAVGIPFILDRYIWRTRHITFPFRSGKRWQRRELGYIAFALIGSYLIMPWYLGQGAYLNWGVATDPGSIIRLFIGTNALGIWDELFFIGTALALLRAHIPFFWANLAQATLFTSFLYELGFRGIGPFMIFFFTLSQGYIFTRTKSFLYVVTIHLTIDFVLFLTLIHLHHPHLLRIFITSPF